jgi:hypothetical protein
MMMRKTVKKKTRHIKMKTSEVTDGNYKAIFNKKKQVVDEIKCFSVF